MKISGSYVIDTGRYNGQPRQSYFTVDATLTTAQDADDLIAALAMFKTILSDVAEVGRDEARTAAAGGEANHG